MWGLKRNREGQMKSNLASPRPRKTQFEPLKPSIYWGNLIIVLFLLPVTLWPSFSAVAPLCRPLTYKQILLYFTPGICLMMNDDASNASSNCTTIGLLVSQIRNFGLGWPCFSALLSVLIITSLLLSFSLSHPCCVILIRLLCLPNFYYIWKEILALQK